MAPTLSDQEHEDLAQIVNMFLGDYDIHDQKPDDFDHLEDHQEFIRLYYRVGKLHYELTGRDYLCGHSYISNYEGRAGT